MHRLFPIPSNSFEMHPTPCSPGLASRLYTVEFDDMPLKQTDPLMGFQTFRKSDGTPGETVAIGWSPENFLKHNQQLIFNFPGRYPAVIVISRDIAKFHIFFDMAIISLFEVPPIFIK